MIIDIGIFPLLYYVVLTIGAIGVISIAYNLQRKYRPKYLSIYFFYLIALHVYWFIVFIIPDLLLLILKDNPLRGPSTIYWLFILFSYPILIILIYFFAAFFLNLVLEKIPRGVVIAFFSSYLLLALWMIYALQQSIGDERQSILSFIYMIVRVLSGLVRFGVIVLVFVITFRPKYKKEIPFIRTICVLYFAGFAIYYIFRPEIDFIGNNFVFYFTPFMYLLINIPPLFYLKEYLSKHFRESVFGQAENLNFKDLFDEYGLTNREQEISALMIEGSGNKEIADKLYISIKTVRNHIYNIFQKFKVNNRTKFFIMIRNLIDNK
jgi:DNA-binding CsgD family transcriptional regulator